MALSKSIETPYGVSATYWRIVNYGNDYARLESTVYLVGYLDQASRNADKKPLATRTIVFGSEQFSNLLEDESVRTQLYNLIKSDVAEFASAEDVLEE